MDFGGNDVPAQLRALWGRRRGDDNFETDPARREYFHRRVTIPLQATPQVQD